MRSAADERTRAAAQAADKRVAATAQRADEVAARRTYSAEAAKMQVQQRIRVATKATTAAEFKLDDADARSNEADDKRAQADRVEKLADIEKRKRQSAGSDNA